MKPKPKRPPPRRKGKDPPELGSARAADPLKAALDAMEPTRTGFEMPPQHGHWLFKEGGHVKGPVAAKILMEKLSSGELPGDTSVAREMGAWVHATSINTFSDLIEDAEEEREEARRVQQQTSLESQARVVRWATGIALFVLPLVCGAALGHTVMKERPWERKAHWAEQAPEVALLKRPRAVAQPLEKEEATTPKDTNTKPQVAQDTKPKTSPTSTVRKPARKPTRKPQRTTKKPPAKKPPTKVAVAEPAQPSKNLPRTLTKAQVKAGLTSGAGGLKRCIRAAVLKAPDDIPVQITIAFSIDNEGRAINSKLLERQVRGSTLEKCIQKTMKKIRWPKFYGERKYSEFPFRIKKPK